MLDTMKTDSAVAQAITKLGGITRAIIATGYSEATWRRWRRENRIPDSRACFAIAGLTGIPAQALAGFVATGPGGDGGGLPLEEAQDVFSSRRRTDEIASDHVSEVASLTHYEQAA